MYGLTERGSADPGYGARVRRDADAPRGGGRAGRRHAAQGADGRASSPRNRIGPVRDQYAGVGRRPGLYGAAAGAGAGTVRAGHQRAGLGDGAPRRSGGSTSPPTTSASGGCCPSVRGEKHEAYAITEEFAGSDVSALKATARRDGDEYVDQRHQVARHVVQPRRLRLRRGGAESASGDHVLLVVDLPWPGVEVVRTPHYSHNIADEHPIVAFNDVRVPVAHLVGTEGETDDVHPGLVPVRANDGGRAMRRRRATPGRRDDGVRAEPR